MKIRKILCGILAGVLICTGNPVISQGKVQAQLQVVRSKTMTVTLEASGGRMVKKASVAGTVTLPSDRNGSDYTFLGWSTKRGQTRNPQYQAYETIKVTRNMHLYPVRYRWSQEPDINVKNLATNLDQYSRIIFVGDSRTVMMGQTLIGQYQNSVSDKVSFICKGRQGLAWMKETAEESLTKALKAAEAEEGATAVVFNLGVNDLIHRRGTEFDYQKKASEYITYMKNLAKQLSGFNCKLFYMSVNPVNTAMKHTRKESEVRGFNEALQKGLGDRYTWIDTYSYLMKFGYTTHNEFRGGLDDGLHYSMKTYKRIYSLVMKNLKKS